MALLGQGVPDFGRAAGDYAAHRQGFPPDFFERLQALVPLGPGVRALDLGTGTGLFGRALAQRGCTVEGLDPSAALLAEAARLDAAAGVDIAYHRARAEETGLPDGAFDLLTAATCWHWFDRRAAAREARRLLKPDGRLVIAHLDWHSAPGNVIRVTLDAIERCVPRREGDAAAGWNTFLFPHWTTDLARAGFPKLEAFAYTTSLAYSHEAWRGRVRASARIGASLDAAGVAAFDADLAAALAAHFPEETLAVDHRIFCLVARG